MQNVLVHFYFDEIWLFGLYCICYTLLGPIQGRDVGLV